MTITLQTKLNGGSPNIAGVYAAINDTCQITAATKVGWNNATTKWVVHDWPDGFTFPGGWTLDSVTDTYFAMGNADPPLLTLTHVGPYEFGVEILSWPATGGDRGFNSVKIKTAHGLAVTGRHETTEFGGPRKRWLGNEETNVEVIEAALDDLEAADAALDTRLDTAETSLADLTSAAVSAFTSGTPTLVPSIGGHWNKLSGTVAAAVLPEASTWIGKTIIVKLFGLTNGVTVTPAGGDTIDGAASYVVQGSANATAVFFAESASSILASPGAP